MTGFEWLAVAAVMGLVALAVVFAALWFLAYVVLWLVVLPFRLLFWLLALPLLAVKGVVLGLGALAGGLLAVVLVLGGLVLAVSLAVAVLTPLLPLAVLVLIAWALVRLLQRPAAA